MKHTEQFLFYFPLSQTKPFSISPLTVPHALQLRELFLWWFGVVLGKVTTRPTIYSIQLTFFLFCGQSHLVLAQGLCAAMASSWTSSVFKEEK